MREYTTGNRIVDASAEISITGNITPQAWYKTIVKETGKPHLAAIVYYQILSIGIVLLN